MNQNKEDIVLKVFEQLQEQYKGNEFFDKLQEISLAIDSIFTLLEMSKYEITKIKISENDSKNKYKIIFKCKCGWIFSKDFPEDSKRFTHYGKCDNCKQLIEINWRKYQS